jgi:peroxiredoxin
MSKIIRVNLIVSVLVLFMLSSFQQNPEKLREGWWRGAFIVSENEIPFLFEVERSGDGNTSVFLINGKDRFQLKDVVHKNDSVFIPVDLYDAVLKARLSGNSLEGRLIKTGTAKPDAGVLFKAKYGKSPRFAESSETPSVSLGGTWDMSIGSGEGADKAVGIFDQNKALLTGSILTPKGDYRFFEGIVRGRKFELSSFGGSTPYLLKGEFTNDHTFSGEFITPRKTTKLEGRRNAKAALPDAYKVSYMKPGFSSIAFSFPNLDGKMVSLADPRYRGKVVIVTILGSWCPNCLDENRFLAAWYKENKKRGVEIIGLGFERKNDFESAKKSLTALKVRLGIEYEILFAGQSGTESASKALPQLNAVASFPTTIFIDKKGTVRKIHSGFSGPATGKFYEEFKNEFKSFTDLLIAEK